MSNLVPNCLGCTGHSGPKAYFEQFFLKKKCSKIERMQTLVIPKYTVDHIDFSLVMLGVIPDTTEKLTGFLSLLQKKQLVVKVDCFVINQRCARKDGMNRCTGVGKVGILIG